MDPKIKNVVESTKGVIFLGTPHRGSPDLSDLGERARIILSVFRMETNPAHLDILGLKTSDLERAQESFSRLWHEYGFQVKTFQEGLGLTGVHLGVLGDKVVPDYSSLLSDHRERAETIQANHMEMCRFTGANDPNYCKVAGELRSIYQSIQRLNEGKIRQNDFALRQSFVRRPRPSTEDADVTKFHSSVQALLQNLKFPTMDSRYRSVPAPAENTCDWFFVTEKYLDWLDGRNIDSHCGLLLLRGKPGAGKSVLMKEVYHRISLKHAVSNCTTAAFFFNAQGQGLERSIVGMFMSLLYQIVPTRQEQLSFCESIWNSEDIQVSEQNLRELVRSLFSRPSNERTFVFIDALDECDSSEIREIAYFWRETTTVAHKSGARLNVLMSTRHFPHIGLSNCPEIRVDHCNKLAITLYIDQKTKLANIPEQTRYDLKNTLVEKSKGVFLWVVFAVKRMLEEWDEGRGYSALMAFRTDLPRELDTLFAEILSPIDDTMKQLTIRLFQWAALAIEPLRLHEWHHVLAFIRQPKLRSLHEWRTSEYFTENDEQLERQIRTLSRGLLEIRTGSTVHNDGSERISVGAGAGSLDLSYGESRIVEFIHESVREYFLRGRGFSNLDKSLGNNPRAAGHLQIMETCLDYLDIVELDSLAEARSRLLQGPLTSAYVLQQGSDLNDVRSHIVDHIADENSDKVFAPELSEPDGPNDISDGLRNIEFMERDRSPEEHYQHSRIPVRQEERSLLEPLETLLTTARGIYTRAWVETSDSFPSQSFSWESISSGSSNGAVGPAVTEALTQVLQDYPAILSYARDSLFSHASKAQCEGANPEGIVRRLQEGSWKRWLLLKGKVAAANGLHEMAEEHDLHSWYQFTAPPMPTRFAPDEETTEMSRSDFMEYTHSSYIDDYATYDGFNLDSSYPYMGYDLPDAELTIPVDVGPDRLSTFDTNNFLTRANSWCTDASIEPLQGSVEGLSDGEDARRTARRRDPVLEARKRKRRRDEDEEKQQRRRDHDE